MKETGAFLIKERNKENPKPEITKGKFVELALPQNTLFPITNQENFLVGFLDSIKILQSCLENNPEVINNELYSGDIKTFSGDMPLKKLILEEQQIYPLLDKNSLLIGTLTRNEILEYLYSQTSLKLAELEAVFSSAHNGIVSINEKGMITSFNAAAEKISGLTKEQALGKYIADVLVPTGLLDVVKTGKGQNSTKYQVGKRKYITNRTPILQKGITVGAVGIFQEISEIETISEELNSVKELNKELSTILKSSYDGVLVADKEGVILKANKACERILNISEEDLLNSRIHGPDNNLFLNPIIEKVLKSRNPITSLETTANNNTLLVTANPVFDEQSKINRVVINVRDMTELNQLRDKLKYTKELSNQYHYELTELRNKYVLDPGIIAHSGKMRELINMVMRVAKFDSTVLLLGESGVGKEVIAKMFHNNSNRRKYPFVKINCGAIPENLLEAELFGYEPGSFTGASKGGKMGLFEVANKGTVLLDEIGDLPLKLQVKLLRVLQEKEILRIGGSMPQSIDVRIIGATNQDILKMVDNGTFRQDLYFRLHVVPINIPPLRERREDIVPLIYSLLKKLEKKYEIKKELSQETIDAFMSYEWPGNIRELENVIEQLFVTSQQDVITPSQIPAYLFRKDEDTNKGISVNKLLPLKKAIEEVENQLIKRAMSELGNTYKVAEALDVNQSTIWRKWSKLK